VTQINGDIFSFGLYSHSTLVIVKRWAVCKLKKKICGKCWWYSDNFTLVSKVLLLN